MSAPVSSWAAHGELDGLSYQRHQPRRSGRGRNLSGWYKIQRQQRPVGTAAAQIVREPPAFVGREQAVRHIRGEIEKKTGRKGVFSAPFRRFFQIPRAAHELPFARGTLQDLFFFCMAVDRISNRVKEEQRRTTENAWRRNCDRKKYGFPGGIVPIVKCLV